MTVYDEYNDAECNEHRIQWSSRERGTKCPACEAETILGNALKKIFRQGMQGIGFVAASNTPERERIAILKLREVLDGEQKKIDRLTPA